MEESVVECIQCPHCQKQYAVNAKLRAASGKKIRCKHCAKTFEIKIQNPADITATQARADEPIVPLDSQLKSKNPEAQQSEFEQPASEQFESKEPESKEPESKEPEVEKIELEKNTITASLEGSDEPNLSLSEQGLKAKGKPQDEPPSSKKASKTNNSGKKKLNVQLLITILLAVILLVIALGGLLFFNKIDLFGSSAEEAVQSIIPQELIKPIKFDLAALKPAAVSKKTAKKDVRMVEEKVEKIILEQEQTPVAKHALPQVCKDISADYWVRSHRLATARMDTATYMKLLDENLQQAAEIRKLCKDKSLIGHLAHAARSASKPAWIEHEINVRMGAN